MLGLVLLVSAIGKPLPAGLDGTEGQNFTQPWSESLAMVVVGTIQGVTATSGKTSWDVRVDEQIGGIDRSSPTPTR